MARVIVGDQQLPAKVVYVGSAIQVWIVNDIYQLFVGNRSLSVTDPEATELAFDIENLELKNRIADLDDSVMFCMSAEAVKPAFLRKKVTQGRNSDSQT